MSQSSAFVDYRDSTGKIKKYLADLGLSVTEVELKNGDVAAKAVDEVLHVFEIKRIYTGDFSQSIFNGHLTDQMLRLLGLEKSSDGSYKIVEKTNVVLHLVLIGSESHFPKNLQKSFATTKAKWSSVGIDVSTHPTDEIACYYIYQIIQFSNHRNPFVAPIVDNLSSAESPLVRALMELTWKARGDVNERRKPGIGRVKAKLLANNRSLVKIAGMSVEELSDAMRSKPPKAKKPEFLKAAQILREAMDEVKQTITPGKLPAEDEEE